MDILKQSYYLSIIGIVPYAKRFIEVKILYAIKQKLRHKYVVRQDNLLKYDCFKISV